MDPADPSAGSPGTPWEPEIRSLEPGDHYCHLFDTPEQSLAVLLPFLVDGLESGHRCVATLATTPVAEVREALGERGIEAEARVEAGDLVFRTANGIFGEASSFDVDEQVDDHERMVARARDQGYDAVRSAGEMAWTSGKLDRETLVRYEAKLNDVFESQLGDSLIGLCQYQISTFEPALLRDVLRAHPLAIHGSRLCENLFHQPADVLLAPDAQAELDRMLDRISEGARED